MKKILLGALFVSLAIVFFVPTQKTQAEDLLNRGDLTLRLSYSPKNPINNPEKPTELTVSAYVLSRNNDSNDVKYTWRVYGSTEEKEPEDWDEILKKDLVDASPMSGYGLEKFKFKLAFADKDLRFIRVKLNIKEITRIGNTNERDEDIVIPINYISNEISAYAVSAIDDGILNFNDPICIDVTDGSPCVVIKNEIIGLELPASKFTDITWNLDEEALSYHKCPLEDCDSNRAVFPILKDEKEIYKIEASATAKNTGKRVTLSREFVVAEPSAFIESTDKKTCAPILLGYFKDLDDNLTPDYSTTDFEAIAGSTVKLSPNFKIQNINDISWIVDATQITKETAGRYGLSLDGKDYGVVINDDGSISFPSDPQVGYSFNVTFSTNYAPNKATKKALNRYWGIGLNDFYEKQIDKTINITVVSSLESASTTESLSENKKNNTLAALLASAPSQLIFLVKIVLISFVLLFSSFFLFSLFPKKNND